VAGYLVIVKPLQGLGKPSVHINTVSSYASMAMAVIKQTER